MNLGNGFIPRVTWKTHSCGVWIWLFQVFWWTPVNIWDQPKAHGSGVRCPVLFWSSPSTFQEEAGGYPRHIWDKFRASPTTNARCMKWQQKMPLPAPRLVMLVGAWRHSYLVLVMRGDTFLAPRFCVSCWVRKLIRLFESFTGCPFHIFFGHLTDWSQRSLQNCLRFFSIDTMWNLKTFGSYLNNFSQRPTSKKLNAVQGACFLFWATLVIKKSKW